MKDQIDLFSNQEPGAKNILPEDGEVNYVPGFLSKTEADDYFKFLFEEIAWKNDEAIIFGKKIITKRKVAWYGDQEFEYTYSKITKRALAWTPTLLKLKQICEEKSGETYNSCLLNLYHNGTEGMAWHSDGEKDLKKNGAIASVSLGAVRKFGFKHKTNGKSIYLNLAHGSLLVMKGLTQTYWLHRLPPSKIITLPRINLTFRTIVK